MLWFKAWHLVFAISWFAAIFYLPRLFVHYTLSQESTTQKRLLSMAYRLYRFMLIPALLTLVFGLGTMLFHWDTYLNSVWMQLKLILVLLLVIFHFYCGYCYKLIFSGRNTRSHVFYRWVNEVPTVLLIGIVLLAVLRP